MDIPDLVKGALDGEEIQAGVSLGDEDAVCLTPTRTLVYRGEGLLSDETVEEYSHDIEQLAVSEGRRKTKFTMQYIDGTRSFTVPANRGEKVLELFLEGVLTLDGVIDDRESLAGVYRFSELTLIVSEGRAIKHIGSQVWSEDFEVYAYDDVTGLEFERASVATSIALAVNGRPQRIKVPNDKAPVVRQTLEQALFGYYDVANVDELNRVVGPETDTGGVDQAADEGGDDDFAFGDDFDPLVSEEADLTESVDADERLAESDPSAGQPSREPDRQPSGGSTDPATGQPTDANAGGTAESAARGTDANAETATEPARPDDGRPSNANDERAAAGDSPDRTEQRAQPASAESESEPTETGDADAGAGDVRQGAEAPGVSERADTTPEDTDQRDTQQARSRRADTRQTQSKRADTRQTQSQPTPSRDADSADGTSESVQRTEASADSTGEAVAAPDDPSESGTETESTTAASSAETDESEPAPVSREEFEAMAERLDELTEAVDRQNELLKRQHRALKQLVQQRDSE